jgi:pimeloyl-ACP methyl ester carboxylesterase
MSAEPPRLVTVGEIELCVQTFGAAGDPALLLIAGAQSSMDLWDDELCELLAAGGRRVIRYDQRDTGRSHADPPGAPTYTFDDLLADAVGILDALAVGRAHVAGISMGGALAMQLALAQPDRILTLTAISTSAIGPGDGELPPPAPAIVRLFEDPPPEPDWHDRAAVVAYVVAALRAYAGDAFDEARARALCERTYDRTRDIESSQKNHYALADGALPPLRPRLGQIRVPTLIVHGTRDPLFPIEHGELLADEIPDAALLALPGVGHEQPPPRTWETFVPALLGHTARAGGVRNGG